MLIITMTWGHEEETQKLFLFIFLSVCFIFHLFLWHRRKLFFFFFSKKKLFLNLFFILFYGAIVIKYFIFLCHIILSLIHLCHYGFLKKKHYLVILLFIWLSYDEAQMTYTLYIHTQIAINFHQKYYHL